jgi:hypothetical protein
MGINWTYDELNDWLNTQQAGDPNYSKSQVADLLSHLGKITLTMYGALVSEVAIGWWVELVPPTAAFWNFGMVEAGLDFEEHFTISYL